MTRHKALKEHYDGNLSFKELLEKRRKEVDYIFLGVGLTLFAINLSAYFSYLPLTFSIGSFYLSLFTSIILIIYSVYEIYEVV